MKADLIGWIATAVFVASYLCTRAEALRRVQLQMLRNPKRQHPYYWASFIQSGEWANLDGKR